MITDADISACAPVVLTETVVMGAYWDIPVGTPGRVLHRHSVNSDLVAVRFEHGDVWVSRTQLERAA